VEISQKPVNKNLEKGAWHRYHEPHTVFGVHPNVSPKGVELET